MFTVSDEYQKLLIVLDLCLKSELYSGLLCILRSNYMLSSTIFVFFFRMIMYLLILCFYFFFFVFYWIIRWHTTQIIWMKLLFCGFKCLVSIPKSQECLKFMLEFFFFWVSLFKNYTVRRKFPLFPSLFHPFVSLVIHLPWSLFFFTSISSV